MAVRGCLASMRSSSAWIREENVGEGKVGSEGCGVIVWSAGRWEVKRVEIWDRVWGLGSGSMSEGC